MSALAVTSNTIVYLLPTSLGNSTAVETRTPQRTRIVSPRGVDPATCDYDEFSAHFYKLKSLPLDRSLWVEGVEPPSEEAMFIARSILHTLQAAELLPTRIVASAEGGVAICFVEGNKYSDIECLNTGAILGVVSDKRIRPTAWEIEPSARGFARATARIREFIEPQEATANAPKRAGFRPRLSPA